uniref:Conserved protein n=1 Tax=Dracunculus medinensis TaxID=318479 RepID=A0A0N4U9M8_DRAME
LTNLFISDNTYENYVKNGKEALTEEVVEENAEDFIRYETFYSGSCDDYELPYLSKINYPDNKTPNKYYKSDKILDNMSVVPGRIVRGCLDIFAHTITLLLLIIQLGLLDYYYLTFLKDKIWYAWIGADALVVIIFIWLFILAVRYNQEHMEEASSTDGKVKFAWIAWFAYSIVLTGKIIACFRIFYNELPPTKSDNNDKIFDDHLFRLGLSLSLLLYVFLVESHHYTSLTSIRQLYIIYLTTAICFDLIDTIYFLDLLWQSFKNDWNLPLWTDITIISLVGVNIILPTFSLLRLRFERYPRISYFSDKMLALVYVLIVNGPYLGIRIYLYVFLEIQQRGKAYNTDLLVLKNIAMIYLATKEVWNRIQYWRQRKNIGGSNGHLTAAIDSNEE